MLVIAMLESECNDEDGQDEDDDNDDEYDDDQNDDDSRDHVVCARSCCLKEVETDVEELRNKRRVRDTPCANPLCGLGGQRVPLNASQSLPALSGLTV